MSKAYPIAAGVAALALSCAALAQFGPPPPGSAQGTESGTYGSSIGSDVRGTGPVDRFGRPYDPMNPTDTGGKPPVDTREKTEKLEGADSRGVLVPGARTPADSRAGNVPGANMNPGLSPGSSPGGPPSMSPNMNPGLGVGSGAAPAGSNKAGGQGAPGSR